MKSLIVAVALVGPALAQSVPACVTNCLNNMLGKASELGCPGAQAACLCSKIDFGYGVRDCSTESCPPGTDFSGLPALAVKYCGSTTVAALQPFLAATGSGAASAGAASGTASAGAGAKTPAITTEAVVTTFTSDGKTFTSTVGSKTVYASPLVSTYTSDGKTFTTTYGTTTITGGAGAPGHKSTGAAASASASASAALASAKSSASAAVSSVASSASSALASASSSASSAGALPMATLAIQNFAGVAGIAAMLAL